MFSKIKLSQTLSLIGRVRTKKKLKTFSLIVALVKGATTKKNFPLSLQVKIDEITYCLIDWESLCIVSPNFEAYMTKYLDLHEGDVFIDAGAHIGKYSLLMAKKVGQSGKIVSIEANPEAFNALQQGIKENKYNNVEAFNCAVFNKNGAVDFFVSPSNSGDYTGRAFSSIVPHQKWERISVQTLTLDEIVSQLKLNKVDLIKIDVESVEKQVLEGAKKTLEHYHPKLIIESGASGDYPYVMSFLEKFGYKVTNIALHYYYAEAF